MTLSHSRARPNIPPPTIHITPSSDSEDASAQHNGKPKCGGPGTPYYFIFPEGTPRGASNEASDADDEHEISDFETHPGSDAENENDLLPSQNRNDQGLSVGVKKIVLGKRERHHDETSGPEYGSTADKDVSEEGKIGLRGNLGRRNALTPEEAEQIRACQVTKRVKM